mmetsp:Transcript_3504/g.10152  ORF Transcript_3504/g.10152 Transcript_3504/m.10152 type:complete len:202 (+) Transcript_3504:272-877(+)
MSSPGAGAGGAAPRCLAQNDISARISTAPLIIPCALLRGIISAEPGHRLLSNSTVASTSERATTVSASPCVIKTGVPAAPMPVALLLSLLLWLVARLFAPLPVGCSLLDETTALSALQSRGLMKSGDLIAAASGSIAADTAAQLPSALLPVQRAAMCNATVPPCEKPNRWMRRLGHPLTPSLNLPPLGLAPGVVGAATCGP